MRLSVENENELVEILRRNPNGLDQADIWTQSKTFTTKTQLGMALEFLTQRNVLTTKYLLYFLKNAEVAPDATAVSSQVDKFNQRFKVSRSSSPASSTSTSKPTPVPAPSKMPEQTPAAVKAPVVVVQHVPSLKDGDLRRTIGSGAVAMCAYVYRNTAHELTAADLKEIMGSEKHLYNPLIKLVDAGYLTVNGCGKAASYRWSGAYKYPFDFVRPNDMNYVRIQPQSWGKGPSIVVAAGGTKTSLEVAAGASKQAAPASVLGSSTSTPSALMPTDSPVSLAEIEWRIAVVEARIDADTAALEALRKLKRFALVAGQK